MKTAGVVLDFYDDPTGALVKMAFPTANELPESVKEAHILTPEDHGVLRDDAYALILHNEGKLLRKFACVDEGNTVLSCLYFAQAASSLPAEAVKVAAANLAHFCDEFGYEPPDFVKKAAGGCDCGKENCKCVAEKKGVSESSMGRSRDPMRQPLVGDEADWASRTNLTSIRGGSDQGRVVPTANQMKTAGVKEQMKNPVVIGATLGALLGAILPVKKKEGDEGKSTAKTRASRAVSGAISGGALGSLVNLAGSASQHAKKTLEQYEDAALKGQPLKDLYTDSLGQTGLEDARGKIGKLNRVAEAYLKAFPQKTKSAAGMPGMPGGASVSPSSMVGTASGKLPGSGSVQATSAKPMAAVAPPSGPQVKAAALQGMSYDPNNANIKALQQQHGANWKGVLAKQRGISADSIQPNVPQPPGVKTGAASKINLDSFHKLNPEADPRRGALTNDKRHVTGKEKNPAQQHHKTKTDKNTFATGPGKGDLEVNAKSTMWPKVSSVVDVSGQEAAPRMLKKTAKVYALGDRYPLDSYPDVKAAVSYFDENWVEMDPADRHEFAVKTASRATELGIGTSEMMDRYGATEYAPDLDAHISTRKSLSEPQFREIYDALLEKRSEIDPEVFAEILRKTDEVANLSWYWGGDISDPYMATFGPTEKLAESVWSWQSRVGDLVNAEQLNKLARNGKGVMKKHFSQDLVEGFINDPIPVFESLPDDTKTIIARLAASEFDGLPTN